MSLSLQFLGTGTSVGVPQIGCKCPACTSADPRDRRRRTGVYVRSGKTAFLVDTPPELREACIELGISKVDAVVVTHAHMDHIAGFDDVRRFNTLNGGTVLKCHAAPETIAAMRQVFPYITVEHGGPRTNGYLFEADGRRIAYISDCISIPARTMAKIRDVDVMVVDCLRERAHPTHMNLELSLAALAAARARRGYLVHMSHSVVHAEFSKLLPRHVRLAYDGLTIRA